MTGWERPEPYRVLITGGDGQVAHELLQLGEQDSHVTVQALPRAVLDITSVEQIRAALDAYLPDYVVNTAAFNRVDAAEHERAACFSVNDQGVGLLANECGALAIPLIQISTDYVFDGRYASGYSEEDKVAPLGVYGESMVQGEAQIRQYQPHHIILRTSWLFSARGDNHLLRTLARARRLRELAAADDRRGNPTSAADVARVILAIIKQLNSGSDAWGTYHYCGAETTTRYNFTEAIIAAARQYEALALKELISVPGSEMPYEVERPVSSLLKCKKLLNNFGIRQRPWRNELTAVTQEMYATKSD